MSTAIVVGGGIGGLSAAYALQRRGIEVSVFEADDRLGGKIQTAPFAGLDAVDCGADAFLGRVPWALDLCRELGIADQLISPAKGHAYIYTRGELRPIPMPNLLGVPLDLDALAGSGIVSGDAVDHAAQDLARTHDDELTDADESLGSLVRRRLGDEILERLVDPLLGGIYAGDADYLSLRSGAPQIDAAARADASLISALRAQRARTMADNATGPVFFAPPNGMSQLVHALEKALENRVFRGRPVQRVERDTRTGGWAVDGEPCNHVVLAVPSPVAAELLTDIAPNAAHGLRAIDYASVALVTMAFERTAVGVDLDASGFLVPKTERLAMTACSWSSAKWSHLDAGRYAIVRASAGYYGNDRVLGLDDDELIASVLGDMGAAMDLRSEPVEVRLNRWPRSFPQYTPGHESRVEQILASMATEAPSIALVGAAYRGIGIPAIINGARSATEPLS